jgi:thiamine biosynthesis lipoprotein
MGAPIVIRVKRAAMNCEFELVLCGADRQYLLDASEEAFEELARLEEQLSAFIPTSEISEMNSEADVRPVRIDARLFDLLAMAQRISRETHGAFDISAGPLVGRWRANTASDFTLPSPEEIRRLLSKIGMAHVRLDNESYSVSFDESGVSLNLGAIGKGYAVGEMASLLRQRGIEAGLVSGGTSTVYAFGQPPDDDAWTVGVRNPVHRDARLMTVRLRDEALSTSGGHERFTEVDGVRYSHVIDPRTGQPADHLLIASVVTSDPAETDALSTAFLVLGLDETKEYCGTHDGVGAVLVPRPAPGAQPEIIRIGL